MWKSGLIWLPRPLNKGLAIWANFGPLWAKISKIGGETLTFFSSPRLYLPIGIQNWPYFCWGISLHFWLGLKSQVRPLGLILLDQETNYGSGSSREAHFDFGRKLKLP